MADPLSTHEKHDRSLTLSTYGMRQLLGAAVSINQFGAKCH